MNNIKKYINKLIQSGFFSIVVSNTLVKAVAFVGGTVLVRVLSKSDYGLYSYVNNAMGFLLILGDMGASMAMLQLTQENIHNSDKMKAYCAYGFKMSFLFCIPLMLCVIFSPFYYPYNINGAKELVVLLFAIPVVNNLNTYMQTNLRAHLQNSQYALLNVINIVLHYVILLPLSFKFGIKGAVLAQYGYGILTLCFALFFNRKILYLGKNYINCLRQKEKKDFIKLAIPTQLNSMIAQALILIDIFMVSLFIGDKWIIASYKVSTTIPSALAFIPASIMIYAIPYFARHIQERKWVSCNLRKLLFSTIIICGGICVIGEITANWVIPLIFGEEYQDAIVCYRILIISFFFSGGIQTPCVNVIYTQRKIKVNLAITFGSAIVNVFLNIVGISNYGMKGAALATMITSFLGAGAALAYLIFYLKNNNKMIIVNDIK